MKIVVVAHMADIEWCRFLLRSIDKFVREPSATTVIVEDGDRNANSVRSYLTMSREHASVRVVDGRDVAPEAQAIREGYVRQQYIKLAASRAVGEGVHLQIDCDHMFTGDVTASSFCDAEGLPLWHYRSYDEAGEAKVWQSATQRALGMPVSNEYMISKAWWMKSHLLSEVMEHLRERHGDVAQWLAGMPKRGTGPTKGFGCFSEYNVYGAWVHANRPNEYHWTTSRTEVPMAQGWSWGGLSSDVRDRMNAILGAS